MDALETLKALPEEERLVWLEANASKLTSADLQAVADYFNAMDQSRDVVEYARAQGDTDAARSRTIVEDEEIRASEFVAKAREAGASDDEIRQAGEAEGIDVSTQIPEILPSERFLQETHGIDGESDTVDDFLESANLHYGTDFKTWDEFYNSPYFKDPLAQQMVETYGIQPEPEDSFTMRLFSGEEITYRTREYEAAVEQYGFMDQKEFQRVVRLADTYGMRRADGSGVAWQPLQALLEMNGIGDRVARRQANAQSAAHELNAVLLEIKELKDSGSYQPDREALLYAKAQELREKAKDASAADLDIISRPKELAEAYKEGMSLYGNDDLLAFFHATDEGLAARISASNHEDGVLAPADARLAAQYLGMAGFSEDPMSFIQGMIATGYTEAGGALTAAALADYLAVTRNAGGAGGGGAQRSMPDPVAINQAAKDFYRGLFLEDPDEATLANFSSQIMGAISGAADNQNIDPNARIRQIAEGLPEYQRYYGKKPAGMSEEEYQGMHRSAQGSMLGDELADNQAVKIGMQDGAYQTTVGAAAGTKEAWDNSTFLGRLARASQTVSRNT